MPWNFHLGLRCGAAEGRRQQHHQKRGGLIVTSLRPVKNFFKKNHFGLRGRSRATAARDGAESNSPVWERKIPSWRAKGAAPYTALCPLSSAARMADERAWRTSRMSSRECRGEAMEGAFQRVSPPPKPFDACSASSPRRFSSRENAVVAQRRSSVMASAARHSTRPKTMARKAKRLGMFPLKAGRLWAIAANAFASPGARHRPPGADAGHHAGSIKAAPQRWRSLFQCFQCCPRSASRSRQSRATSPQSASSANVSPRASSSLAASS